MQRGGVQTVVVGGAAASVAYGLARLVSQFGTQFEGGLEVAAVVPSPPDVRGAAHLVELDRRHRANGLKHRAATIDRDRARPLRSRPETARSPGICALALDRPGARLRG
jgi:hypothetical protein